MTCNEFLFAAIVGFGVVGVAFPWVDKRIRLRRLKRTPRADLLDPSWEVIEQIAKEATADLMKKYFFHFRGRDREDTEREIFGRMAAALMTFHKLTRTVRVQTLVIHAPTKNG